ncbi:MAG: TlpA family protein disulfide reductase, partial [Candidatus Omnitrophica bacterium]|nr:TlpA family protein disulfide reductase [Candidatus Omnitrophota bacterium]
FWATWCPSCREEIPELRDLNKEYKDKGLKILAVDIGESQKKVDSFAKQQGIEYTILLDLDNRVANQYGVMGIPTNILIDKEGNIAYRGTSPPPEHLLPQ